MYRGDLCMDKDLIQRVCDLTCSKDEIVRNQTTIKYDLLHPFRKYYNIATIKGAMGKFISNEWDDITLSHWACIYCWVLSGGYGDTVTEDLNTLEGYLRDIITWALDGLSFFDAEYDDDPIKCIRNTIELFENYDHIWQTLNEWNAIYAMIGPHAEENEDQYVVLINHIAKEYMIVCSGLCSGHLENGFEDKYFKFALQEDFIKLINQLKTDGYNMISCSEDHYYTELEDL